MFSIKINYSKVLIIIGLGIMVMKAYGGSSTILPIKVGVLQSLTGTLGISGSSVKDGTLLAIEEINKKGGILGRPIKPIIIDIQSNWSYAEEMAKKLILEDKVSVVFGCWTSACRKTVKPVFEKYNNLLIYPVQYEGLEGSPNILYTGATPNQQIIPAIKWAFKNLGKSFFLVGSDYVFPRVANELIKHEVKALGGEIVGEEYLILGSKQTKPIAEKIISSHPAVIINTLNGDSNISFFKHLRASGITSKKTPTLSFSIAEKELQSLDSSKMVGDYAAWNYFQSIPTSINQIFVSNFKKKYCENEVTDDPIESAYFGVFLWAQAVKEAGTDEVTQVRKHLKSQSFNAPEGRIQVDQNNHVWKKAIIGKISANGQFHIMWESKLTIQPIPYPDYRNKKEWNQFLEDLYKHWDNHWVLM